MMYFYELPVDKQMKISDAVREALKGVVADDRLEAEVNCVTSGRVADIAKIVEVCV